MSEPFFTTDHEWIKIEGDQAIIGITDYAQKQLGDIVFVDLPELGRQLSQGDEAAIVESVKAASEVYAPIGGEVAAINEALVDDPALVNREAMIGGWFLKLKNFDPAQCQNLMDGNAYRAFIAAEES